MEKYSNKENRKNGGKNMKITSVFKVKKCLFDSNSEFQSSKSPAEAKYSSDKQLSICEKQTVSPDILSSSEDSPYSLYTIRKRRIDISTVKLQIEDTTPSKINYEAPLKRSSSLMRKLVDETTLLRASSPDSSVKLAVQNSIQNPDLIGDFSKPCILPIIQGKHPDLKTISPNTVADLLQGSDFSKFTIIDCRYPYEFEGGHIKSARNIYFKGDAEQDFFSATKHTNKNIFIFYCEFSSERAPSMMRFLRHTDRNLNKDRYPHLYYPELYVIEGGYKAFFADFEGLCEPQNYTPMLDKECSDKMSFYRNHCKSWGTKNKRRRAKTENMAD